MSKGKFSKGWSPKGSSKGWSPLSKSGQVNSTILERTWNWHSVLRCSSFSLLNIYWTLCGGDRIFLFDKDYITDKTVMNLNIPGLQERWRDPGAGQRWDESNLWLCESRHSITPHCEDHRLTILHRSKTMKAFGEGRHCFARVTWILQEKANGFFLVVLCKLLIFKTCLYVTCFYCLDYLRIQEGVCFLFDVCF